VLRRQASLLSYADKIEKIYDPNAVSLRREATAALTKGLSTTGKERDEHLDLAMRILRGCIENQGGMQDGSAWFQVGWILWKAGNYAEAEEAFFRCRRLSTPNKDAYLVESCLHVAYMQYLQGRYEDAFTSAEAALDIRKDYETLFDCARYAARTGRLDDALDLLERCIHERPTTVITMFSEEDFCGSDNHTSLVPDMASLAAKVTGEARNRANSMVTHWRQAVEAVRRAELIAMRPIDIPKHLTADVDKANQLVSEADYLTALEWEQIALSYAEQTRRLAKQQMATESTEYRQEVLKTRDLATDVLESTKSQVHASLQEQQIEIDKVPSLFGKNTKSNTLANLLVVAAGVVLDYLFHSQAYDYAHSSALHSSDATFIADVYFGYIGLSWIVFSYVVYIMAFFVDGSIHNARVLAIQQRYTREANSIAETTKDHHSDLKKQAYKAQEERRRADLALQQLDSE
jgi:tetratricopeptide (TPR) repeat protein